MAKVTLTTRVKHLEDCSGHVAENIAEIKRDIRKLEKSNNAMREVVFNGIRDRLRELTELIPDLALKTDLPNGGKKPRRMEILTAIIAAMVGLQTLGLLDGLKAAILQWLTGGTP